jgi:hypothetical protein
MFWGYLQSTVKTVGARGISAIELIEDPDQMKVIPWILNSLSNDIATMQRVIYIDTAREV